MATQAQVEANRENAQHSTGPRTESGKAKSSRNRITCGLYTHEACLEPGEEEIYAEFCQTMYDRLLPDNLLEETFVFEITGASWRLRRCAQAEAGLEDFDEPADKTRRSIERARAAAHCVIQRSLKQLGKLQTERIIRDKVDYGGPNDSLAAEVLKLVAAQRADARDRQRAAQQMSDQMLKQGNAGDLVAGSSPEELASNCNAGDLVAGSSPEELASNCNAGDLVAGSSPELASNCNAGDPVAGSFQRTPQIARNAQCPCRSGEKYKRCCGKTAPPLLGKAA